MRVTAGRGEHTLEDASSSSAGQGAEVGRQQRAVRRGGQRHVENVVESGKALQKKI